MKTLLLVWASVGIVVAQVSMKTVNTTTGTTYATFNAKVAAIGIAKYSENVNASIWPVSGKLTVPATYDIASLWGGSYFKGIHGSAVDTLVISKMSARPMHQIFDTSVTVLFAKLSVERFNVLWFGAKGDGVTDDTKAIRRAVNAACLYGGEVYFPYPGIYKITDSIRVKSNYAVSLISEMGADNSNSGISQSYIKLGSVFSGSVINLSCRGGLLSRLWFRDSTSVIGSTMGTNTCNAVVTIDTFTQGKISDCYFDGINGSAVEAKNWIRGTFSDNHIRDCGTATRPAVWFNPSSALSVGQVDVNNMHSETCRGLYFKLEAQSIDTKINNCQFEADPSLAASNKCFIWNIGQRTTISGCGFNRDTATQVYLRGSKTRVIGCHFDGSTGGVAPAPHLIITGQYCNISTCDFYGISTSKGHAIIDSGGNNFFTGCHVYYDGNVVLYDYSTWTGGGFYLLNSIDSFAIKTKSNNIVTGAMILNNDSIGGISLKSGSVATGNLIYGNGGFGIFCQSNNCPIYGNRLSTNDSGSFKFSIYPIGFSPNNNFVGDAIPLQDTVTLDPPSLAQDSVYSGIRTVTGAAFGDVPLMQFPTLASATGIKGIIISASITNTNTVRYQILNKSGATVDLDSGLLTIKVFKQ